MSFHKSAFFIGCAALLLVCAGRQLRAQTGDFSRRLLTLPPDTLFLPQDSLLTPYQLPDRFLIPRSETVYSGDFRLLPEVNYDIDYQAGTLRLRDRISGADTLRVIYRKYPFPLPVNYFHRELQPYSAAADSDSAAGASIAARAVKPDFLADLESYQSNLQKSGSIVRGIEVGNNQDLTLNSGLNLQLSGEIAPDVQLVAALTDQSTPIQPEGNTQSLREVDNVFVKINSPYVGGTLGDFNLAYENSQFGNLRRKLQGVTVENPYKNTRQQVTFGTSRGIFHSNRFLAQEGNQGPYLLTGKNGEREIIVLAGTERVFVDGQAQVRGENNDYVIDYSQAQITFTNKRLITSENRIDVDFEYTSNFQRYGRNLLGVSSSGENMAGHLTYDIRLFREWDDTNNLLEDNTPLTEQEKAALQLAGDDPLQSVISGADSLGPGKGDYLKRTEFLPEGGSRSFFVYVGPDSGVFKVRFTGVGSGKGDYRRVRLGVFEYVGPGRGSYLPVRLVPLAADKRFADVGLGINLSEQISLNGEFSLSQFDQNVFSDLGDGNNQAGAWRLNGALNDSSFHLMGKRLGKLELTGRWTRQEAAYNPLDRALQPEYAYKWNLDQNNLTNEENSLEAAGAYQPRRFLRFDASLGSIDKGQGVSSTRRMGQARLYRTPLPDATLRYEWVNSRTSLLGSNWQRGAVDVSRQIQRFRPRYQFKRENRAVDNDLSGTRTGFIFQDHLAALDVQRLWGVDWSVSYQNRTDFLYNPRRRNSTLRQAITQTYQFQGVINSRGALTGQFSFAMRDKNFTDFFEQLPRDSMSVYQPDAQFQDTTWRDRESNLANFEFQYRHPDNRFTARWDYRVASELQALREKVYIKAGENRGNFRFDSTLNEYVPDPQGDFFLVLLQTGNFESVTNLETAWQFQYRPATPRKNADAWSAFLQRISTFTYIKIEEQSREPNIWDIYLLRLSKFHRPGSSVRGAFTINQDIDFNERNPDWGVLLRSRYQDVLSNQFLDPSNNESRITWERSVQVRKLLMRRKLNVTGEYRNSFNKRWVTSFRSRNLNILSQSFISRINLRPDIRWQLRLDVERGIESDRKTVNPLRLVFWNIKPQISYSLHGKARATADLTFIQVNQTDNPGGRPIPFEMARGKKEGNSWQWSARFEYFVSNNITINVNYTGRRDAEALRTLHLGRAEVRAFF